MQIVVESNSAFEAVSKVIFDETWKLEASERLYLHTWFSRLGPTRIAECERLLADLAAYLAGGDPSAFLCWLSADHPKFLDWFGRDLVGNQRVSTTDA